MKPYTRAELVAALNAVAPNDWEAFFRKRVDEVRASAPIEGIEAAGWRLVYGGKSNAIADAYSADPDAGLDLRFSLGMYLTNEQNVSDIVPGSPAALAGIGSGAQIVAVNSRAFSTDVLSDALKAAKESGAAIELLVKNADFFTTHKLEYRGGERHPHLVRDEARADLLSAIFAPRTWKPEEQKAEPPAAQ